MKTPAFFDAVPRSRPRRGEIRVERPLFKALSSATRKFARRMIAGLSQRIERLVRELDRQALGSGRERFIDCLLHQGRGQACPFVPAAKAESASQLNLTPEHFSRILHELAQAGLLDVQGRRITVPDPARLPQAR